MVCPKTNKQKKHGLRFFLTQDVEGHIGLAQADRVQGRADLAAVLPGVLLGHSVQGHRRPIDGGSAFEGTWEECRKVLSG